jgi:peptidoglycan/xylan/chitin deacetylase (PgdA/CDA1 family)
MFEVTLTFDNGPELDVTPQVLDTLRSRGLKATFFVLGSKMADPVRRALAERAHDEGHWIGNHTYTHSEPLGAGVDPNRAEFEIGQTEKLIGGLARPCPLFRPNGGGGGGLLDNQLFDSSAVQYLKDRNYTCVLWDTVPRDWEDPDGWVDRCIGMVRSRSSSLVVLHDLPTGAMKNLERFLDQVEEAGGRFSQEFPDDCVVMRRGKPAARLAEFVNLGR